MADPFDIFCTVPPGLEPELAAELSELGFAGVEPAAGGVALTGGWPEVWRANLLLRGASRVLVRLASFRVVHLSQLDKLARRVEWARVLTPGTPVRVEASCRKSKIYHDGAAAQRVAAAAEAGAGVSLVSAAADAEVRVLVRIEDNVCTISLDTSGELLHRRGYKTAVAKAPMRETLAALFLRACGHVPGETVLDPMCGSGTFVIEAAERSAGLAPGRARRFAFERFSGYDAAAFAELRRAAQPASLPQGVCAFGSDRDAGAIRMSRDNAERAGVAALTGFETGRAEDIRPPDGAPGLVVVNPPYGARIGNKSALVTLHGRFGQVLRERFSGWRVGLVTSDPALARATRLPFEAPGRPVDHGGLKIRLYTTGPLD